MPYDPNIHHRRSIRLPEYDYASEGAYFITICTAQREYLFGIVQDGTMQLNNYGQIVADYWHDLPNHYTHILLDAFVVMPDHIHGIIVFVNENDGDKPVKCLSEIVRAFKSFSARRINHLRQATGISVWQRNYYEHIIRNERDLQAVREYIATNPVRWAAKR